MFGLSGAGPGSQKKTPPSLNPHEHNHPVKQTHTHRIQNPVSTRHSSRVVSRTPTLQGTGGWPLVPSLNQKKSFTTNGIDLTPTVDDTTRVFLTREREQPKVVDILTPVRQKGTQSQGVDWTLSCPTRPDRHSRTGETFRQTYTDKQ